MSSVVRRRSADKGSSNMKPLVLATFLSVAAFGADFISSPCTLATNFPADLQGTPDQRPGTWGEAGAQVQRMTFRPPGAYRVRILRVHGDHIAWARGIVDAGRTAGVLLGLQSADNQADANADFAAADTML